ncbi:MAG TPA: CsgG/HfaB family protein [Gemmatimonadales bacterium]|nr:CsgG/HfaB family protein [Gemmatimonadales bacterium]
MRGALGSAVILAALCVARPAIAQGGNVRFAVLPFENTGSYGQDKEVFEALELGLAAMIARAIDGHPGADVVQRAQLDEVMRKLDLGPAQRVDAASAAQLGKGTGARYTITGSFADFYGKFRINARLVNAESGEIVKVVSNDDPKLQDRAQLAAIAQTVGQRITSAAGLAPYPAGSAPPAIPTDAITAYSRGLLHESRGERAKASQFYQSALSAFPGFEEAAAGLKRVRGE